MEKERKTTNVQEVVKETNTQTIQYNRTSKDFFPFKCLPPLASDKNDDDEGTRMYGKDVQ